LLRDVSVRTTGEWQREATLCLREVAMPVAGEGAASLALDAVRA
jgi:hypothetical protein